MLASVAGNVNCTSRSGSITLSRIGMMNSLNLLAIRPAEFLGVGAADCESISPLKVEEELQRILTSPQFEASDRNRRFLAYVVEETLAGRGERIKAYNIATTVFGRDDNFDPQLDPVVRMEARRLRRSLERFYLVEGEGSAVRIAMPKGSYMPKFQNASVAPIIAKFNSADPRQPVAPLATVSIFVAAFEVEDNRLIYKNHSEALSRQIAVELSRFPAIEVFTRPADFRYDAGEYSSSSAREPDLSFTLGGNATLSRNALRVTATLVNEASSKLVWGETFEQDVTDKGVLEARETVACRIVRTLAGYIETSIVAGSSKTFQWYAPRPDEI
jgi:adenylate cyclase